MILDAYTHETLLQSLEESRFCFLVETATDASPTLMIVYANGTGMLPVDDAMVKAFGWPRILSDLLPSYYDGFSGSPQPQQTPSEDKRVSQVVEVLSEGSTGVTEDFITRIVQQLINAPLQTTTDPLDSGAVSAPAQPTDAGADIIVNPELAISGLPLRPLREVTSNAEIIMPTDATQDSLSAHGFVERRGAYVESAEG